MCVSVILCKRERYCHFACALSLHRLSPKKYKYIKKKHITLCMRLGSLVHMWHFFCCLVIVYRFCFGLSFVVVIIIIVVCCCFFFRGPTTKKCVFSKNYKQKHKVSTSMLCKQKITDRHESNMFVKIKNLISEENFDVWIWGYLRFYCMCVCLFFFVLIAFRFSSAFSIKDRIQREKNENIYLFGNQIQGIVLAKVPIVDVFFFFLIFNGNKSSTRYRLRFGFM